MTETYHYSEDDYPLIERPTAVEFEWPVDQFGKQLWHPHLPAHTISPKSWESDNRRAQRM